MQAHEAHEYEGHELQGAVPRQCRDDGVQIVPAVGELADCQRPLLTEGRPQFGFALGIHTARRQLHQGQLDTDP